MRGTPVSAIEALASGRLSWRPASAGVPDVVRDEVDGFLVEPGDTDGAAERLALSRPIPRSARGWASRDAPTCGSVTRSSVSSTTSTACTGRSSPRRGSPSSRRDLAEDVPRDGGEAGVGLAVVRQRMRGERQRPPAASRPSGVVDLELVAEHVTGSTGPARSTRR
jgi:hypothetical protein